MDELTQEFLVESREGLDRMEQCLTALESRPQDAELLSEIFRSVHTIKGTTGFLGFRRLEKLAHGGENLLGLLRDGKIEANAPVVSGLLRLLDCLRSILNSIEAEGNEGEQSDAELIASLDRLQRPVGTRRRKAPRSKTGKAEPLPQTVGDEERHKEGEPATGLTRLPGAAAIDSTLRVDIALLNRLMNLVGELVLTRNQILQATSADPGMTLLSRRLDMVTADLRENIMKARMQPVSSIFSKIPRIVRDLAQQLGRRVRLQIDGQETELDKSLLEAIKDPLTHAVRNALDHGIETPETRIAAGKDPEGRLWVAAVQQGSHVIVEVRDDGAGIAVDKVRAKAIERGLVAADRAALMQEREILQLIFVPGFSTAASVTNVSGRGVGMDVVRTNVEKIGGKVEIESRAGSGTTLRLRIPLTLAIIPALIVRSLGQSFALPQAALSELVHMGRAQNAPRIEWIDEAPLIRRRGHLLPLVFLDRLLDPDAASLPRTQGECFIAVLDADGRQYGLVVDGLADPEEIVVKPLSPVLKEIGIFSGATVLGSAELALILDPGAIAARCGITSSSKAQEQETNATDSTRTRNEYLVVNRAGSRGAIPLDTVLRIEQVPGSAIERVKGRLVLNSCGRLLPLDDARALLQAATGEERLVVVVRDACGREVGIAVTQVLDVLSGEEIAEAGTGRRAQDLRLLNGRITEVLSPDPDRTSGYLHALDENLSKESEVLA